MRIEVKHPAFRSQRLAVETASAFRGPQLLLDGTPVMRVKGRYPLLSDTGEQVLVKVGYNLVDPIPTLQIGGAIIHLATPLRWYEYGWGGLPLLLVFAGGALGGLVGALATVTNGRIFRSDRSAGAKYGLAGLVSVSALVTFLVLVIMLQVAIRRFR